MNKKNLFINVIRENEGLIFKVASLYTNSLHDKEDLYQEIVFQLWKSFDSFNDLSKLSTWMYRVAMNTAIYTLKSAKRKIDTISIDAETEHVASISDISEERGVEMLYERIKMLNLLDKGIIMLYLEGKSHQEIAEIVGISTSNVGTKISRIKEKLKHQVIKK